jgi:hypothetical protein
MTGRSSNPQSAELASKPPNREAQQSSSRNYGAQVSAYCVAAMLGYAVGSNIGAPPARRESASTPLARVGFVLSEEHRSASAAAREQLRRDVDDVRASWSADERPVFELVAAVRGLSNGGTSDFTRAEELCRALGWPRCDRAALEELKKRSRP